MDVSWVSVVISTAVSLLGGAYGYGKIAQRVSGAESNINRVENSCGNYITSDRFNECIEDIKRRLDSLDAMEISAQLAEIKTLLMALKEQITAK